MRGLTKLVRRRPSMTQMPASVASIAARYASSAPGLISALWRVHQHWVARPSWSTIGSSPAVHKLGDLWAGSGVFQNARKCAHVARVTALLSEHPVFRAPEKVRVERQFRLATPAQPPVVIADNVLRQAAVHSLSVR